MNGNFFDIKAGFSAYMRTFYNGLVADTSGLLEFTGRGIERCLMWASDRMVDDAEAMLASYRKNQNSPTPDAGALFPVILMAMSKDYVPTTGDWGGRQIGRQMVKIADDPGASIYGYRQAMGDIRTQIAIFAADSQTARSIAAQLALYIGEIPNRRFYYTHKWGQYSLQMPVMLETPDVLFSEVKTDQPNSSILVTDLTLRTVIPYLDAPKAGDPNDGTTNNPPGYPAVEQVNTYNFDSLVNGTVNASGTTFQRFDPNA